MKIEASAYLREAEEGRKLLTSLLLVNQTQEEKTVLVRPPEATLLRDAAGLVLQVGFTGVSKVSGYKIIPAINDFDPVSLREGEAVRIMTTIEKNTVLESIAAGEEIRIKYVVLDSWGERFSLWHDANETITEIKTF